jgi:ubiquinone/menaquinone biosynthesis C-methylase UbiE
VTDQAGRFDRFAEGYERWWAPVLAASAVALLPRLEDIGGTGPSRILDVGVGTGNLALTAVARWPDVEVTGIDASREMVEAVERLAEARLSGGDRARFDATVAFAHELPFKDSTFDAAMSSFVLQLVPSRPPALREIRRVLRPGGRFAYVTWLKDDRAFEPDRVFDQLLDEFGFDEEADEARSGDLPSVDRAASELRRAGFRDVAAELGRLEYPFTVDGYIAFLTEFDEESLFESMRRAERHRFLARFRERLMTLDPDRLVFRVPIVYATGVRSDG